MWKWRSGVTTLQLAFVRSVTTSEEAAQSSPAVGPQRPSGQSPAGSARPRARGNGAELADQGGSPWSCSSWTVTSLVWGLHNKMSGWCFQVAVHVLRVNSSSQPSTHKCFHTQYYSFPKTLHFIPVCKRFVKALPGRRLKELREGIKTRLLMLPFSIHSLFEKELQADRLASSWRKRATDHSSNSFWNRSDRFLFYR